MAISINGARFLTHEVSRGLKLGRTTVVGRQGLFAPPFLLRRLFVRHGIAMSEGSESFFRGENGEWADSFLQELGARPLEFLDASDYEGATRIHDLNQPMTPDWDETCDTLIDSGSLEHVFDAKTAIENYLRMVRVGGTVFLLDMPAANLCGHGFYQFSPEFFCEVFSEAQGFELQTLALAANWGYSPFYSVARPREVGGRVEIPSREPCHIFVCAKKIGPFRGFAGSITQSDYAEAWSRGKAIPSAGPASAGPLEAIRRIWRRVDPVGYWRFSTRRDCRRGMTANAAGRSPYLVPLDI
jgi:hypothetical protein